MLTNHETPVQGAGKGNLTIKLRPRQCSNCPCQIPLHKKGIYLDMRVFTENGWLPHVVPGNTHDYWIFCGLECLRLFSNRVQELNQERLQAG